MQARTASLGLLDETWCIVLSALTITFVLTLSCYSNYHSSEIPFQLRWQFSPLGLLQHIDPESLKAQCLPTFHGRFAWTWDYAIVFLKTCLLEAPFYYFALRSLGKVHVLACLLLGNLMTHPLVFFVFPLLIKNFMVSLLGSEFFAASAEFIFVTLWVSQWSTRLKPWVSGLLVVAANLFSWEVGMFI